MLLFKRWDGIMGVCERAEPGGLELGWARGLLMIPFLEVDLDTIYKGV